MMVGVRFHAATKLKPWGPRLGIALDIGAEVNQGEMRW